MRDAYYGFHGGRPVWPFARPSKPAGVKHANPLGAAEAGGDDMTDNELPPSYPACFEGPQQFDEWCRAARRVSEESNPCDDCTAEYAARMRDEGRCDREYVQERFVINKRKKRIGVVA